MYNEKNNILNLLNCDISYEIIKYLDYKSSKNFILCSKKTYNMYISYQDYINTLFIRQIYKHFYLKPKKIKNIQINKNDKNNCYTIINKIYNHFCLHRQSSIIDFIIFLIENTSELQNIQNTENTFKMLLDLCKFHHVKPLHSKSVWNRHNISISDMKYIITYSSISQLEIILEKFNIHSSIISYSIQEILEINNKCKNINTINKINILINYLFYKYCFNNKFNQIDNLYFHKIITTFIKNHLHNYFNYIFIKKDKYKNKLEYRILLDDCIEYNNFKGFKILFKEYNLDNELTYTNINTINLENLCVKGNVDFLIYIINNILKHTINYLDYINSIINGLKIYNINNNINDDNIIIIDKFQECKYINKDNLFRIKNLLKK